MNEICDTIAKLGARTEIFGNKSLVMDGCDGIVDAEKNLVIIKSGRMLISVRGKNLKLTRLTESSLSLKGSIHSVSFEY